MTVTLDDRPFDVASTHRMVFGTLTLAAYVTGGMALALGDLKLLGEIERILFEPATNATPVAIHLKYDAATATVLAFAEDGTEVADATDLSAYSAGFIAFGK